MPFEVMFKHLKEDIQELLLKKLGLKTLEEGNLDIAPIAVIWTEEDWENESEN